MKRLSIQMEHTMGISKMAKKKDLQYLLSQMVRKISQNIILINYMAVERRNLQVVTVIGGNTRMANKKDMEQKSGLMD
jgi:hypothetical protein